MGGSGAQVLTPDGLQALITLLRDEGYTVIGPTVRDGAIVHAELVSVSQLPQGVGDAQDNASYRLRQREDAAWFGYAVGPQSWKPWLFPAREPLWSATVDTEVDVQPTAPEPPRLALLGVRSCDLHAIAIHDRVLADRAVADTHYVARRQATFVVALTCSDPAGTCFCVSMDAGPVPRDGYDLALTELLEGGQHRFVIRAGSEYGGELLTRLAGELTPAGTDDLDQAEHVGTRAATRMGRTLDRDGIRDLLYAKAESPRWDEVASRCLACSNCTLVCPTCFCTSIEDSADLTGTTVERTRVWDSCFTADYSYIHGGSVRMTTGARYRQWATHKLASWIDQFGTSGCVGCGRCITWCPAAIDLTAEVAALRAEEP